MATRTPHNELFLFAFEDLDVARGELRAVLPRALLDVLDLDGLEVEANRLVDDDLSARFCDVLYRAPLRAGGHAFVWILLEHQSTADSMMGLRLLEYMVRVWSKLRRAAHPQPIELPVIVPVVLQHDPAGWPVSRRFSDLYESDGRLRNLLGPLVPDFTYILDDLSAESPETLAGRTEGQPLLRLVLWSLQGRGHVEEDRLPAWTRELAALTRIDKHDAALAVVRYNLTVTDDKASMVLEAARRADPELGRSGMTFLERAEAKGRGDALLKLLTLKFGPPTDEVQARVGAASLDELDTWIERILAATSVDEVFAD